MAEARSCDEDYMKGIEDLLSEQLDYRTVRRQGNVTGGIINKASLYNTHAGQVFVKYANRANAWEMFTAEMEGLKLIADTGTVRVPSPQRVLRHPDGGAILVMEYIPGLQKMTSSWGQLGSQMGRLHADNPDLIRVCESRESSVHKLDKEPVRQFGFHCPMHMGSQFQIPAVWCDTWEEFYIRHVLQAHMTQVENTTGDRELLEMWSVLQSVIHKSWRGTRILPSLIHGDFCSINVGQVQDQALVFDPTVMYGHSENDFTILFMEKDFPETFYEEYRKSFHSRPPDDSASKLVYLLSASLLLYLYCPSVDPDVMQQEALKNGKELLNMLKC